MEYDIVIRLLARAFFARPPSLAGSRLLGRLAERLGVDEFDVQPAAQVNIGVGEVASIKSLFGQGTPWRINVTPESVDLEYLFSTIVARTSPTPPALAPRIGFDAFLNRASAVFVEIADSTKEKAHRLAAISEGLLPEMTTGQMDEVARRLLNFPTVFGSAPWEWDWRCVQTTTRTVSGISEAVSMIAVVKRLSGRIPPSQNFDRIRVDLDFNTSMKKTEERFGSIEMREFFAGAVDWHAQLAAELARHMGL